MKAFMSACLLVAIPLTAEARPKFHKILSEGEPGTCSMISGQWEGECSEAGKSLQAKLQIFQDGCTDIAFFDFDYPIPLVYKIGREGKVMHTRLADTFWNFTTYASWLEDRKTFTAKVLGNAEFTDQGKVTPVNKEESYTVSLKGETLETSLKLKIKRSNGSSDNYETICTYRRVN
ncbi:MAG TPA: hypothetical protein VE954_09720 [Oligoflexus sp.]|uniref:hypothetical protein n=1 Tax=Oligoflexus sp. TaxID=1971216 RepID=UPI002D58271B|nr:hypothetical protein [Oligoflexus sp.]HYX33379.1 hypothetical protein [Oligoflexus sp.]